MTIEVQFSGYVNEIKELQWGRVLNVSHAQRTRATNGEWVTEGYDYLEVIPADPEVVINKGDILDFKGKLKTKKYTTKDGEQRVSLQVRAYEIKHRMGQKRSAAAVQEVWGDIPPQVEETKTVGWPEVTTPNTQQEIPF